MKRILYTVLSVVSIIYIGFLAVDVVMKNTGWSPNLGAFKAWFDLIVDFGGVAIIFCFALVNFAGSPLKTAFFILLILAIMIYATLIIILKVSPELIKNLFNGKNGVEQAAKLFLGF